jgi:hypothetical protein
MVDKKKFEKETEKKVKESSTKLYPVSDKDIDIIKGDSSESGSNSYAKTIQAAVKALAQGGSVAGGVAGSVAKKIAKD